MLYEAVPPSSTMVSQPTMVGMPAASAVEATCAMAAATVLSVGAYTASTWPTMVSTTVWSSLVEENE